MVSKVFFRVLWKNLVTCILCNGGGSGVVCVIVFNLNTQKYATVQLQLQQGVLIYIYRIFKMLAHAGISFVIIGHRKKIVDLLYQKEAISIFVSDRQIDGLILKNVSNMHVPHFKHTVLNFVQSNL